MVDELKKELGFLNFPAELLDTGFMTLDLAKRIALEIEPLASGFDREGVTYKEGRVILPSHMEAILAKISKAGLLGTFLDERYGGARLPFTFFAALTEIFAEVSAAISIAMAVTCTVIEIIRDTGTESARGRYLPLLARGDKWGAISFSEAEAGSDIGNTKTVATFTGDGYLLNGTKQFVSNGGIADIYIVLASIDKAKGKKGLGAFIMEKETRGLSVTRIEEKLGLNASPTAALLLEDCFMPKENLLGKEGKGLSYVLKALTGSRITVAAQAVGIANAAYKRALRYSQERTQFGRPISNFQAIRFKLADMITAITAGRKLYLSAAFIKDRGEPFTLPSSMAKLFASEMAKKVTDEALQIHGGYGYMKDYDVERFYRDARITTIYEGTSEIQRVIISREILKDHIFS